MRTKHPVLSFFLAAYGFSWLFWIPLVADSQGWVNLPGPHFHIQQIGAFGPTLAALVLARRERKALLASVVHWRVNPLLYLVALFGPALYLEGGRLLHGLTGGLVTVTPPVSVGTVVSTFIFLLLYGGPLQEELGWRGFALPRMQARLGFWGATFSLGALWALWHLPLFFVRGSAQYGTGMVGFFLIGIGLSILMGWVYNASGGSVLIALLTHAGVNTAASFIRSAQSGPLFWTIALVGATILLSMVVPAAVRRALPR